MARRIHAYYERHKSTGTVAGAGARFGRGLRAGNGEERMATGEAMRRESVDGQGACFSDRPFGARFLEHLRSLGGSLGSLRYADLQRIKRADRTGMIRILEQRHSLIPHALLQAIRELEPEEVAEGLHRDRQLMWAFLLLALA